MFLSWTDAWRLHHGGRLPSAAVRCEAADALRAGVVEYARRPEVRALEMGDPAGGSVTVEEAMVRSMLTWPEDARRGLDAGAEQWCQLMAICDTFGDEVAHWIAATLLNAEAVLFSCLAGLEQQVLRPLDGSAAKWKAELLTAAGAHCVALKPPHAATTLAARADVGEGLRALMGAAGDEGGRAPAWVEQAEQLVGSGLQVEEALRTLGAGVGLPLPAEREALYSAERQRLRLQEAIASGRPPGLATGESVSNLGQAAAAGETGDASDDEGCQLLDDV